ncbi:FadR/GntR family transcriptional regulator [Sphingomonas canadensis]|uniref:FadR/GntR family transcriptional regulator n=1 Tax=Sphingomonas canadensis TaxID=1219257 RepID=A0ABW3H2S2_9SPHN|nr:FadR/GntR family transcriptional regulator [Sphingomonas canadensis]MCW3834421.1 FadR family transcriptional regulator [Sphingomonas canadensis]
MIKGQASDPAATTATPRQTRIRKPAGTGPIARAKRQPRPKSLRLHGAVARTLGVRIVSGEFAPGDLLEGEIAASEKFDVSRTAYREAIRILAAKGLVHSRPKIGTQVSPRSGWHLLDPDVLNWMFANEPDPDLIEQLFELRRIVEPDAARLAAMRRTPEQLARMAAGIAGVERHGFGTEEGRHADQEFHAALLEASGNDFVISLTTGVSTAISLTTEFKQHRLPSPRDALPEHVAVFEAIAASDAQGAHDAMARLVDRGLTDTMEARAEQRARRGARS